MMQLRHTVHSLLFAFLVLFLISSGQVHAQGDSRYKNAPALTGRDGKVFIGIARGVIYKSSTRPDGGIMLEDSLLPGVQLPADLHGVWDFAMPNQETHPNLIVGLASYAAKDDEGNVIDSTFGFLKSTDFGESWTLTKPAAFDREAFRVTNNFWLVGLTRMTWLPDAQHGWIFGKGGIVRTTDGGDTWAVADTTPAYVPGGQDNAESGKIGIWGLGFKNALEGVAARGTPSGMALVKTTDGGVTWAEAISGGPTNRRVTQIDWMGLTYRAFTFDRNKLNGEASERMYFSEDGRTWSVATNQVALREQTHMNEVLWAGHNQAFLILRSGEIWKSVKPFPPPPPSTDQRATWTNIQQADSSPTGYPVPYQVGWGQRSILIKDQSGRDVIVHASTISNRGDIYRLYQWLVEISASAPGSGNVQAGMNVTAFPNPASTTADIRIDLNRGGNVSLSVVNLLGVEVLRHDAGRLETGRHDVAIDLGAIPSGSYRVIATCGDETRTTSLVVNR